jgi:hypothetical protein
MRRHDWIIDLLTDLQDYAVANGLPDLALSVEAALVIARREAAGSEGLHDHHPARRERAH